MKHLKIYENYKDKMKSKNKFNNTINEYIPGFYMVYKSTVFNYRLMMPNEYLALCRIMTPVEIDDGFRLDVDVISYVCELDQNDLRKFEMIEIGIKQLNITSDTFEKIFMSSSLKLSQDKFEELKKTEYYYQWELNKETNKFNL